MTKPNTTLDELEYIHEYLKSYINHRHKIDNLMSKIWDRINKLITNIQNGNQ